MDNSQETTPATTPTAAPAAATPAQAPAAPAPAPAASAPTPEATAPAAAPATEQTPTETPEAEDYSFVPAKFLRDGKPDMKKMSESYTALEKKISAKAGVAPEDLDDYKYEAKNFTSNEDESKGFKEFAKEISLSPKQYEAVMARYDEIIGQTSDTPEKAKAYLEKHWGHDFERNQQLAVKAFETYVPSHIPIEMIGNNPYVMDILARVGAELGEDTTRVRASTPVGMSRDEARELIAKRNSLPQGKERDAVEQQIQEWYGKNIKD